MSASTQMRASLGAGLLLAVLTAIPLRGTAQPPLEPILEWLALDALNAAEGTSLPSYDLNTSGSQIRLLGAFKSNYFQGWYPAVDSGRGLLYLTEAANADFAPSANGSIAVVDLKTLLVARRMIVESGGQQAVPTALSFDPVGNRLFVSDGFGQRLWIIDAASGALQTTVPFNTWFFAYPYVALTHRLYGEWPPNWASLDVANLGADPEPVGSLPAELVASYMQVNDATKLLYASRTDSVPRNWTPGLTIGNGEVWAIDIDPTSPTFHQAAWTGPCSATIWLMGCYQAFDRVRHRLYSADVNANVIRVFDESPGSQHQELAPIPLNLTPSDEQVAALNEFSVPPNVWPEFVRWTVMPEVDPVTGLVYAVITSQLPGGVIDGCVELGEIRAAEVVTIDPAVGIVGRAPLPKSVIYGSGLAPLNFITIDPGTRRILVVAPWARTIAVLEDQRPSMLATAAGTSNVTVTAPEATITFQSVQSSGTTTIEPRSIAGPNVHLPGQFTIDGGLLYEVSTTATISGSITLCFSAAHMNDPAGFEALHVLHAEGGAWADRTISRNFDTRTICAQTTSLSPFAVAKLTTPAYAPRLLYSVDRSFRAGATAPIKVQILNWAGTNVSAPSLTLRAVSLNRTSNHAAMTLDDTGSANPDMGFRFDAMLGGYIFNLSTRGLTSGTYTLTAEVGGGGHFIQLPISIR